MAALESRLAEPVEPDLFDDIIRFARDSADAARLRGETSEALRILTRLDLYAPGRASAERAQAKLELAAARSRLDMLALAPNSVQTLVGRGNALLALGQELEASEAFLAAARLEARNAEAFFRFGWCMLRLERHDMARTIFTRLTASFSDPGRAYCGLAQVATARNEQALALEAIEAALAHGEAVVPWLPFSPLFKARRATGSDVFERGWALDTLVREFHVRDAVLLLERNRTDEGLAELDRVLAALPGDPVALAHKVGALRPLDRMVESMEAQSELMRAARGRIEQMRWAMVIMKDSGAFAEAIAAARQILRLDPRAFSIRMNAVSAAQHAIDWEASDELVAGITADAPAHDGAVPFDLISTIDDAGLQQLNARTFATRFRLRTPAKRPPTPRPRRGEKIRLVYFSNDFQEHATMRLLAEVLELRDRTAFHVEAWSYGTDNNREVRSRAVGAVDRFVDVTRLSTVEVAAKARAEGVHIFVDLKGWTKKSRSFVLVHRPAPIQATWLGFPGPHGIPECDYAIVDPVIAPAELQGFYDENLVLLPHSYQPNDRSRSVARTPSRAEAGLPEDGFVFACLNQSYKITAAVFAVWMRLLTEKPGSTLWLMHTREEATERLRERAAAAGIDPGRLVFADTRPNDQHLARYHLVDLALDTFPTGSHTTMSDCLWAGAPMVTLCGQSFASRVPASVLTAAGVPELITHTIEEYETLARALANDDARRIGLRRKIALSRENAPLFDSARFARHLEKAWIGMVERWDKPESFAVPA